MVIHGKKRPAHEHIRVMWIVNLPSSPLWGQIWHQTSSSLVTVHFMLPTTEEQIGWNFTLTPKCHLV